MKKRTCLILALVFVISLFTNIISIDVSAATTIAPCKMESTLDIYAGANYYNNLRNPVVKGDSFNVVCLEWSANHYRKDYREEFSYSSSQDTFSENSTYYLKLTLHSLNYPSAQFSESMNAADFKGFSVSLKLNGSMVELEPYAVDNYDATHEYITLIYQMTTGVAEHKIGVTGLSTDTITILVGKPFIFSRNVTVLPANATNQYIEWHFLDDYDGGTNYRIHRGEYYLYMEPMEGATPKAGTITLVAQIQNGKENGQLFSTTLTIRVVNDEALQGNVQIPMQPVVGEELSFVLDSELKKEKDLIYTWEYKNDFGQFVPVTKVKKYGSILNDKLTPGIGLIGKEIRLNVTSSLFKGSVVSETKYVKKNIMMASPSVFVCCFQSGGVGAVINSDTHLLQEFVLMKSSTKPTEAQWKTLAKSPSSMGVLLFTQDENGSAIVGDTTYTIYSRFKATENSDAGTEVISATYYTGFKCSLDVSGIKLVYDNTEYKSYDTIIVDLNGKTSVTFKTQLITSPGNANEWKKHVWKLTGSETADFSGVGNAGGSYYKTLNYQSGNEYYDELKAVFTKQGTYYLSAEIDGSADKYAYYTIKVVDSTKHIDEYLVSVYPSNSAPTSLKVGQNEVLIPEFVSRVSISPAVAQKDYKIVYKEATYKSGSYGNPYTITDNEYIDVDETTGAITGVKKTGSATNEKGYMVVCIYDTTTQKTKIVSGTTVTVSEQVHTHTLTEVSKKAASCTESGYSKTFYICGCGKWFSDSDANNEITNHASCIIDELGHDLGTFICEIPATHASNGTVGHYHCSRCNKDFDSSKNELKTLLIDNYNHKTDESTWAHDDTYHWHNCVLYGCDVELDKTVHSVDSKSGKCTVCKAQIQEPEQTKTDETTKAIVTTKEAVTTQVPISTKAPDTSKTPVSTGAPVTTGSPVSTQTGVTTVSPETTITPEQSQGGDTVAPEGETTTKATETDLAVSEKGNNTGVVILVCCVGVILLIIILVLSKKKKKE